VHTDGRCRCPGLDAERQVDSLEVLANRLRPHAQDRGDLRIGLAARDPGQDFGLSPDEAQGFEDGRGDDRRSLFEKKQRFAGIIQ
jgi:hypothetical protein